MKFIKENKFNIVAIIVIIIFAIGITSKTFQNDTFYTIKIGEVITEYGVDMIDHFSWHEGLSYTYPHWAYDTIVYGVYSLGNYLVNSGFLGIYIFTGILACILGILIYKKSLRISKRKLFSLVISAVCLYLLGGYITARAQLVTYILFILEVDWIEKWLKNKEKRYLVGLFILSVLISNLHSATWIFYFILYLPYIAEYLIVLLSKNKFISKYIKNIDGFRFYHEDIDKKTIQLLIITMSLSILGGVLNLNGTTSLTYLVNTAMGNSTSWIMEHQPTVLYNDFDVLIVYGLFFIIFILSKVRIKISDVFMLLGLMLMALNSSRHFALLVIIGVFIFVRIFSNIFNSYKKKNKISINKKYILIVNIVVITVVTSIGVKNLYNNLESEYLYESNYPIELADYILDNLDIDEIRLFNGYNYGSYLLYRGIPVFVDSRADLYLKEFNPQIDSVSDDIFTDVMQTYSLTLDYKEVFEHYNITHIIVSTSDSLGLLLEMDSDYTIVYEDDYYILYERNITND